MNHIATILLLFISACTSSFAEMRGIDVEVSTMDDRKVVVTIRSAVGNENKSGITVDQASKILSDAKGWGSSVVVFLYR